MTSENESVKTDIDPKFLIASHLSEKSLEGIEEILHTVEAAQIILIPCRLHDRLASCPAEVLATFVPSGKDTIIVSFQKAGVIDRKYTGYNSYSSPKSGFQSSKISPYDRVDVQYIDEISINFTNQSTIYTNAKHKVGKMYLGEFNLLKYFGAMYLINMGFPADKKDIRPWEWKKKTSHGRSGQYITEIINQLVQKLKIDNISEALKLVEESNSPFRLMHGKQQVKDLTSLVLTFAHIYKSDMAEIASSNFGGLLGLYDYSSASDHPYGDGLKVSVLTAPHPKQI